MVDRPELRHCEPLYEHEARIKRDPERVPALFEVVVLEKGVHRFTGLRCDAEAAERYRLRYPSTKLRLVPITWKNKDGTAT